MIIECPHQSFNVDLIHDFFEKPSDPTAKIKENCEELQAWACGLRMYFTGPASVEAKMAQNNGLDLIQKRINQENTPQSPPLKKIAETHITAPTPIKTPQITTGKARTPLKKLDRETFTGELANGVLKLNRHDIAKTLSQFEDCRVEVVIERERKNRSIPQNKYYWAVIVPAVCKEIGEYDEEEIHAILKTMHNKKTMVVKGKEVEVVRDTKGLNTQEFGEYCERVRTWAAQFLSVSIPDPDKNWVWKEMPEMIQ